MAPPSTPLWRQPGFRRLYSGRLLTLLGDAVIPAALALALLRATGSVSALAFVLGCALVPKLVLLPVGGVVADRLNARTVVVATDAVRCAAQLVAGLQFLGGQPSLAVLAAAQLVSGAASAFAAPALTPLITGAVAAQDRRRANSLLGAAASVAQLSGLAIGGTLVLTAGPGWTFVLDAATFAASGLLLLGLPVRHVRAERRSLGADLHAGWGEVRSRGWYWTSLIVHGVWNMCASVLVVLGPAVAVRELGGEGVWVATTQAGAVGLLLGALLAGRLHPRRPALWANLSGTLYAAPLALLAVAAPAPWVVASYALAMGGLGFLNSVWQTTVQQAFPEGVLARVTSYDWLLSLGAMPVGYALAPLAAEAWGTGPALGAAAVLVAVACLGVAAVPDVRRFTLPAPGAALTLPGSASTPASRAPIDR